MSTVELGQEFISHHGVLGMKWGVHKDRSPTPVTTSTSVGRRTSISTSGGVRHPAHPDAIKVAMTKQKIKGSGLHAASNQELRDLAARADLEDKAARAVRSKGQKFLSRHFESAQNQAAQRGIQEGLKKAFA